MGGRPILPRALLLGALALGACAPGGEAAEPAAPSSGAGPWPAGTVLAVEDQPITLAQVDQATVWVERIEPEATTPQLRRLALTNVVLPRVLTRLMAGEARDAALAEARAALSSLRAGTWPGPRRADGLLGEALEGGFHRLGLEVWGVGTDLEEGAWSEPIEDRGRFLLLRRTALRPAAAPLAIELELDALVFPFVDSSTYVVDLDRAYDRYRLTIVDPDWRALVPESIQYRMGASPP